MTELLSTMAQVPLVFGCRIVFEAIDPATGLAVAGVNIVDPVVYGYNLSLSDTPPVDQTSPLWVPVESVFG